MRIIGAILAVFLDCGSLTVYTWAKILCTIDFKVSLRTKNSEAEGLLKMNNLYHGWKVLLVSVALAMSACATTKTTQPARPTPEPEPKAEPAPAPKEEVMVEEKKEAVVVMEEGLTSYTVVRGDSLWDIASYRVIYGNPYQWPLIYKANSDQIKDADLIYPGQVFSIPRDMSASDIEAAISHARTRGAWSLGVVEESDQAYLSR
jgi:LysM repeat protein